MGNPEARCMTWAVPQRYPPGYPAVTQGSMRGLTNRTVIARRESKMRDARNTKPSHPPRAQPYLPVVPTEAKRNGEPPLSEVEWAPPLLSLAEVLLCEPLVSTWGSSPQPPSSLDQPEQNLCIHPGFFFAPSISPRITKNSRHVTQICPPTNDNGQNFQSPSQSPVLSLEKASLCEPQIFPISTPLPIAHCP